tara:strand:+ start:16 stop:456 length:441 start_codon:yes stop_codon:yes gene_type:complete
MQPIPVTISGETILVPRLKVQQIIDLQVLRHERDRLELIKDLEDSGVPSDERLERLREHRNQAGLASVIVRSAFTIQGAHQIIRLAMDGEFPDSFGGLEPTEISKIALKCIGLNLDEFEDDEDKGEGWAEGKASPTTEEGGSVTAL